MLGNTERLKLSTSINTIVSSDGEYKDGRYPKSLLESGSRGVVAMKP